MTTLDRYISTLFLKNLAFILLALAYGMKTSQEYMTIKVNAVFTNLGAAIFIGVGVICALFGGLFLDYAALNALIPIGRIEWHSFGIFLVEVGVGITVMSIMVLLYWNLSSGGALDEGL